MTSFDKVYLSPQLLPLLGGTLKAELGLELAGGRLDAAFGTSSSSILLSSSTEDFDLSQHPIELEGDTVGLQGLLDINGDIEFNTDDIKESSGDMAITIENFGLTGGSISGFTLSETQFSEAELKFEVEDGKAKVTKGSFVGDMLEATVEGHITLRKDPMKSRLALKIKVRFDDTLDRLAKIALKDSRDEDGLYHFKGKGTIMKPRWSVECMSCSSASRRSTRATNNDDDDEAGPTRPVKRSTRSSTVSAKDRYERLEKRKERLKERRERMRKRREDRRARQAEPDPEDYDAMDDDRYEEANFPGNMENDEPMYEDEIEPEYNDYEDPNGPNENMEDLGYIDE
jgi:type II secretion system protein N